MLEISNSRGSQYFEMEPDVHGCNQEVDWIDFGANKPADDWQIGFSVVIQSLHQRTAEVAKLSSRFNRLFAEWKSRTMHSSNVDDHIVHPAYLGIIGMGKDAIPFILAELEKGTDYWFPALCSITEEQPVAEEDFGKVNKMTAAWIKWGRDNGYRW